MVWPGHAGEPSGSSRVSHLRRGQAQPVTPLMGIWFN